MPIFAEAAAPAVEAVGSSAFDLADDALVGFGTEAAGQAAQGAASSAASSAAGGFGSAALAGGTKFLGDLYDGAKGWIGANPIQAGTLGLLGASAFQEPAKAPRMPQISFGGSAVAPPQTQTTSAPRSVPGSGFSPLLRERPPTEIQPSQGLNLPDPEELARKKSGGFGVL